MSRSPDILFMAEYIKNVLYFATVREGRALRSSAETHFFSIDDELVYENYYSDFGPLNLGCVYKYCKILNDKLKQYLNKQKIVHYTTIDPKKKANSAFLLGCYGVLYLSLLPKEALKPLMVQGQSYRPFQDATQGESGFTISLMDCLQAIKKAKEMGFFNFQDFNCEEYERLDKIQGGDLNWIVPGKFLAFIGPVDYSVSMYHPPEMYIDYFLENQVKIVIRLNKRLYDGNVFSNAGINHYDLFFPDGSCPPRHILMKFLQISEESDGAIAVHCKAGLGRTGSLIGCYLIKHYRMTSHEAIGWMRICRPGSVIGHQQAWLEQLEVWLIKQGNLYRKRMFNDADKFIYHEFGIYSIAEKTMQQRPVVFHRTMSPTQQISRQTHSDITAPMRAQSSRVRDDKKNDEEDEIFLTSCDLTVLPSKPMTHLKGCIIKTNSFCDGHEMRSCLQEPKQIPFWKKIFCCKPCLDLLKDGIWTMSVHCARVAPDTCKANRLCACIDMVAANKTKKESFDQWRVRPNRVSSLKVSPKGKEASDSSSNNLPRRGSGAGEPRSAKSPIRNSARTPQVQKTDPSNKTSEADYGPAITTFRTTNGPVIKNVTDARNFLLKSSMYREEREKQLLMSSITVTPRSYSPNYTPNYTAVGRANPPPPIPTAYSAASRGFMQSQQRRRLGRSPSPLPIPRMSTEHSRATNTPPLIKEKNIKKNDSKSTLRDALSRLKLTSPRDRSIGTASVGAASLGARRDAPMAMRAPSVRSDERPLATQGDLLNSIKFQRRLRDTLHTDKFHDKLSINLREKPVMKVVNSRTSGTGPRGLDLKPSARDKSYIGDVSLRTINTGTRGTQEFKNSTARERSNYCDMNLRPISTSGTRGGQDHRSPSPRDKSNMGDSNPARINSNSPRGGHDFRASSM